jgi:hypothetical protein
MALLVFSNVYNAVSCNVCASGQYAGVASTACSNVPSSHN